MTSEPVAARQARSGTPGDMDDATARRRPGVAEDPLGRVSRRVWRTLTNVRFAVLQITLLVIAGVIGALVRQIPSFALKDPAAYATELGDLHRRYDVNVGPGLVDLADRLGFFRVFSAPWFTLLMALLVVSIVVCTLDRTPRMWRGVRHVRVVEPAGFFDLRLPERARYDGATLEPDDLRALLRSRRFKVREAADPDDASVSYVYGDRNQYFKMATLLTHLGLILFLAGGAVTGAFGYETVLFVGNGQTAPVQPVGTPHNLLVKNLGFEAPRRADGSFEDFRTTLAVYQDGREIARKTIRVNDPLSVAGFVFHQNTFGPAADMEVHDAEGRLLWTGPVLLAGQVSGQPQGWLTIPGASPGIAVLTLMTNDGTGPATVDLLGLETDGAGNGRPIFGGSLIQGGTTDPSTTAGYAITWRKADAFTGMVVKQDPGQGLIWLAYGSLIAGLLLVFYFPRRRVWARISDDRVELALVADRYVDASREFSALLADIGARTGRHAERRQVP